MSKNQGGADQFAAIMYNTVTETAANTLTFAKFETGYGTLEKRGIIIHRLEYYLDSAEINKFAETLDEIFLAITKSNMITTLSLASAAVLDLMKINVLTMTAVGIDTFNMPVIRDFSNLPGGGLIALPNPLFLGISSASIGTVVSVKCRVHFTTIELTDQQWMELVEQTRLLT